MWIISQPLSSKRGDKTRETDTLNSIEEYTELSSSSSFFDQKLSATSNLH